MKSGDSIPKVAALVGDSSAIVRAGIKAFVCDMVGQVEFLDARNVESVLQAAKHLPTAHTRLAFVNSNLVGSECGFLLAEMALRHPQIRIVAIGSSSPEVIRRAMNVATVCACVSYQSDESTLRSAIQAALEGRKVMPATEKRARASTISSLTPRQNQVYDLLRRGMSNKVIADALRISEGTVKNHMTEILKTLNATNRTQAAQFNLKSVTHGSARSSE